MAFSQLLNELQKIDLKSAFLSVTPSAVERSLSKSTLNHSDLINLLSPAADDFLESMAQKSRRETIRQFGRTIQVYTPIYISNYCSNKCLYCGFSRQNHIKRKKLTLEEIEAEAAAIAASGLKHILVLTGEAREATPLDYLSDAVKILRKHFPSVSIEMLPLDEEEYSLLKASGVDGVTVYQESYDREIYKQVHLKGKKSDYEYRLATPERAATAGIRSVNIGALFGLSDPLKEAFYSALHLKYLTEIFTDTEFSISMPRINSAEGGFKPQFKLDDRSFVKIMTAYRLFLPTSGITISTRESPSFRDNLLMLGATKFSAGSTTKVGGHSDTSSTGQFDIADHRSVEEFVNVIKSKGYDPVYKDWDLI